MSPMRANATSRSRAATAEEIFLVLWGLFIVLPLSSGIVLWGILPHL